MAQYTCTITYPGGDCKTTWDPEANANKPCKRKDEVTFISPNQDSGLNFSLKGSPFVSGDTVFTVPKGTIGTKQVIADGALDQIYPFTCAPGGKPQPGSGGEVPVGS